MNEKLIYGKWKMAGKHEESWGIMGTDWGTQILTFTVILLLIKSDCII